MTLNSATRLLDAFLEGTVSTLGFERVEALGYSRPANDTAALLSFPCRIDPRGPCCFYCHVGVRFECLEKILRGEAADKTRSTVMMPLHLLRENKSFTEWQFHTSEDFERLRDPVMRDLTDIAFPFIERYSKLPELRQKLQSPTPADWFILGPEQRLNVLAAIQFVQGDKSGALKTLDDALLERKTAMPSKRLPIEAVRKRLTAASG